MSIIKKSSFPLHLDVFKVLINDTNPTSRYFKVTQLQDTLTGGKNAFLIQGSLELREGSYLFIEVKDSNGNIIYSEPAGGNPTDYYEGVAKPVSIHVYDDTLFGPATITIVGELKEWDDNGIIRPIPDEWRGKINVKWQKTVNVNPFIANTTPIRLYRRPKIDIQERLLPIYTRTNAQDISSGYFRGVAIFPPANTEYPYNGPIRYEIVSINPTSASFISNTPTLLDIAATPFDKRSVGRPINVANIYSVNGELFSNSSSYTPVITELVDRFRAIVDIPFVSLRTATERSQIKNIALGEFDTTYETSTTSVSNLSSSYASINVKDLETFSGDIYRLKVFAKSRNELKGFSVLEDIVLEENELLQTDFFAPEGQINKKTGEFTIANVITEFWSSASLDGNGNATLSTTDNLVNAVFLEPLNEIEGSNGIFAFLSKNDIAFTKDTEYILNYNTVFSKNNNFSNKGLLDVYITGSAFNNTITEIPYGKKIGTLSGTEFQRYEKQSINFKADNDGNGRVSFIVRNGNWELADISLKAAAQTAFNPNELTFLTKPNIQIPSESFDFRFELFDINYTYVPITLEKTIRFGGGNDIIPGIRFTFNASGSSGIIPATSLQVTPSLLYDSYFEISPTAVSASPAAISITSSVNLIQLPLTFDSSSATAYDRDGIKIEETDVADGFQYPGKLIEIINNDANSGPDVFAKLSYANFASKIKPNTSPPGERRVGYITYRVHQSSNTNRPQNARFVIGSDYTNYLGCAQPIILSVSYIGRVIDVDRYYVDISNISPDTEWLLDFKPDGSNDWYFGAPYALNCVSSSISGICPQYQYQPASNYGGGWYVQVQDGLDYDFIDFRIIKKCFGGVVTTEHNEFRYFTVPFILFSAIIPSVTYNQGGFSASTNRRSSSITAGNLTSETGILTLTLSNPTDFEVAPTSGGPWSNSVNLSFSDFGRIIGGLSSGIFYYRLKDGLDVGSYNTTLTTTNATTYGATTVNQTLSGTVANPLTTINVQYYDDIGGVSGGNRWGYRVVLYNSDGSIRYSYPTWYALGTTTVSPIYSHDVPQGWIGSYRLELVGNAGTATIPSSALVAYSSVISNDLSNPSACQGETYDPGVILPVGVIGPEGIQVCSQDTSNHPLETLSNPSPAGSEVITISGIWGYAPTQCGRSGFTDPTLAGILPACN